MVAVYIAAGVVVAGAVEGLTSVVAAVSPSIGDTDSSDVLRKVI